MDEWSKRAVGPSDWLSFSGSPQKGNKLTIGQHNGNQHKGSTTKDGMYIETSQHGG